MYIKLFAHVVCEGFVAGALTGMVNKSYFFFQVTTCKNVGVYVHFNSITVEHTWAMLKACFLRDICQ